MDKNELLKRLYKIKPFKISSSTKLYELDNIIVKVFEYKSPFHKFFYLKGFKSYFICKILRRKNINVPFEKFYFSISNKEYFGYEKIKGEEILEKLKKEKNRENFKILIDKLKTFILMLFEKKIYHKDFDPTNIIFGTDGNLYLIDLENVSFILTKRRKIKMINKINKFLRNYIDCSLKI